MGDAGTGKILFSFDSGGVGAWGKYTDTTSFTSSLSVSSTDGDPCPGALALNTTYTAASNSGATYNYSAVQDWTGYTKLHAWVKVTTSDYTTIKGVNPHVESQSWALKLYGGWVDVSTLRDGNWHETVISLTAGTSYVPAQVNYFEFQLQTQASTADGGSSAPPATTLLVDSIWLE